jgi:hypothetical protein
MVGWPPDTRPPLGKGPTGKDRPKTFDGSGAQTDFFSSGHDSETDVADSPPRTSSLSPSDVTTTGPSRQMQVIDESWDQALIMNEHQTDVPSSSESTYQLTPMTPIPAPTPSKALSYSSYASSLPSSSRSSMSSNNMPSSNMYMASPASYPHAGAGERPIHNYSGPSFPANIRAGDMRNESPRQHYPYSQSPYQTHDPNMHSPPPAVPTPGHTTHQPSHRESPAPYGHRRSITDNQSYTIGQGFPHLPNPAQLQQQNMRPPDVHRLHHSDSNEQQQNQTYRTIAYGPDGRLNSMP